MKRFKDLLNEFRGSIDNTGNGGSSSGGDEGYNYIHGKIKDFMKKTPFHYRTLDGHDLHFHSSLDAARMVADAQGMHTAALGHLMGGEPNTETPEEIQRRKMMIQYFGKSSGTHHAVMGALESHILNHRDFPEHYHPHLGTVIAQIENEHHPNNLENVAKRALSTHIPKLITSQHPHLNDTAHHLQDLIQTVESEDSGYFLRKEEQA
jgi:hypothetical protein